MNTNSLRARLLAAPSICVVFAFGCVCGAKAEDGKIPTNSASVLPEVLVYGDAEAPYRVLLQPSENRLFPASDAADVLSSIPGVSISRMGGHGLEPFIRGQSQGRLNIIDDGAFVYGGCPNRMDPPTSYMRPDSIDTLVVEKGYTSVTNGPGGSGGTVRSKRGTPVFEADKAYFGSLSAGGGSNAYTRETAGDIAVKVRDGYIRGEANYADANNYKDGNGKSVRSAYSSHGGRFEVGMAPNLNNSVRVTLQADRIEDALFAGAGMDSPISETYGLRAAFDHKFEPGKLFTKLEASGYGNMVDHIMDNYTLRNAGATVMKVASDSDTAGGKLSLSGQFDDTAFTIGGDLKVNNRDAVRYMGARDLVNTNARVQSYSWPDITLSEIGIFGEAVKPIADNQKLRAGLRYDRVDVSADKADRVAVAPSQSANGLYRQYYGVAAKNRSENNVGGMLRYEMSFGSAYMVYAGVSRSVRTADATERGIAQNHNTASNRWVGRPDISPEKHHQADIGGEANGDGWSVTGSIYYDRVSDFILRDKARGQDGILLSDDATVYRNVDATLFGTEIGVNYRLDKHWSILAQTAFTYGENDEDSRPLAQIPPLQLTAALEYTTPGWMAGLRMRSAFRQPRADVETDFNSGQDTGKTGGYAVFDLYVEVFQFDPMTVSLGVSNVFDTVYASHLSRSNAFDTEVVQVNEPGRSAFMRARVEF